MPLKLTSLLGSLKKTSLAAKHIEKQYLDVSKSHSNLAQEFKTALDSLKKQLNKAEADPELDPKGTKIRVVVLKGFTTKNSPIATENIHFFLTDGDVNDLQNELRAFNRVYLKKKNECAVILDLVYVGMNGDKLFFEASKGKTLINITKTIKALNTISKTKSIRIVPEGKANIAANEIKAVLSDWDILVKRFEDENEILEGIYPEDISVIPNAKQVLFQLELPIKKMHRTIKHVLEESTKEDEVVATDDSLEGQEPTRAEQAATMKATYDGWLDKFKQLKAQLAGGSKVEAKLLQELVDLEESRKAVALTVYTEVEVLELLAKYQLIQALPAYKAILVNKEKKRVRLQFKQVGQNLEQMVQNEAVMQRLLEMLDIENTMLKEIGDEVQELWGRFFESVNQTESFQQIKDRDMVQLKDDAQKLIKKLQLQARGLIQATKYLDKAQMTALAVSEKLALLRSSLRMIKDAIDQEVAALQQQSSEMHEIANSIRLAHSDTSIPTQEKTDLESTLWDKLDGVINAFTKRFEGFKIASLLGRG